MAVDQPFPHLDALKKVFAQSFPVYRALEQSNDTNYLQRWLPLDWFLNPAIPEIVMRSVALLDLDAGEHPARPRRIPSRIASAYRCCAAAPIGLEIVD
jgi:hypothetical protein